MLSSHSVQAFSISSPTSSVRQAGVLLMRVGLLLSCQRVVVGRWLRQLDHTRLTPLHGSYDASKPYVRLAGGGDESDGFLTIVEQVVLLVIPATSS